MWTPFCDIYSQYIGERARKNETMKQLGVTKWTKWQSRLERRLNEIFVLMLLWCVYCGCAAMGYKAFWGTLGMITLASIVLATVKHIYYGIKIRCKKRKPYRPGKTE